MVNSLAITLLLLGTACSMPFDQKLPREIKKGRFGATEVVDYQEHGFSKTVMLPLKSYLRDYAQQAQYIKEAQEMIKSNTQKIEEDTIYKCENRIDGDPYSTGYFFPVYVGQIADEKTHPVPFEGRCFQDITFEADPINTNSDEVKIRVTLSNPRTLLCHDWFLFGSAGVFHVEDFFYSGTHEITLKNLDSQTRFDIQKHGLQVYMFCGGYIETFVSVLKTVLAFVGGLSDDPTDPIWGSHVPYYMEKINVDFLKSTMGIDLQEREIQDIDIDESEIHSGDFIAITRLDGLDPIIMYGSGTHAGHSVMALRFDGELYIVESQDGWYWPTKGLQRTKWADWVKYGRDASFQATHMPLSPEARAKFNETAAQEFFFQTEGLPYGYHNFLFGWVDTEIHNWPPLLPHKLIPIVFSLLETMAPDVTDVFITQALNKRLGTEGLKLKDIAVEAANRNMTVEEVMAIPERDHWVYEGIEPRDGWSYVCSAYVAAFYKAAGLFDGYTVEGTEFTPKDVYTLDVFDKNYKKPEICEKADPGLPYGCQIMGKYRFEFPNYSTVKPYERMCEHCPTEAPLYTRPDNC